MLVIWSKFTVENKIKSTNSGWKFYANLRVKVWISFEYIGTCMSNVQTRTHLINLPFSFVRKKTNHMLKCYILTSDTQYIKKIQLNDRIKKEKLFDNYRQRVFAYAHYIYKIFNGQVFSSMSIVALTILRFELIAQTVTEKVVHKNAENDQPMKWWSIFFSVYKIISKLTKYRWSYNK